MYIYIYIYIVGSSEFPTPAGKSECLDTAEAGTFYKVEGETKENFKVSK